MTIEQQQCLLGALGFYTLRRKDRTLAVDGLTGPSTSKAIRLAQQELSLAETGEWNEDTEEAVCAMIGNRQFPSDSPAPVPDWTGWPGKHFTRGEFKCQCGGKYCSGFPVEPNPKLVRLLDAIREHFGQPVLITSGIRCKRHNANVGGVANSQHLHGTAADIIISGVNPSDVAAFAETLLVNTGGIGRYPNFTHVDVREEKSRWWG